MRNKITCHCGDRGAISTPIAAQAQSVVTTGVAPAAR